MGLLGSLFKAKKNDQAREPIRPRIPTGEVIEHYYPDWLAEFPDFPYQIEGRMAMRTSMAAHMCDVVTIAMTDKARVAAIVDTANALIGKAHELAEFPDFAVDLPGLEDELANLSSGASCVIRCVPFTEKARRISKYPFRVELTSGRVDRNDGSHTTTKMTASLFADGLVGRIECEYSEFTGGMFGHFWMITSKLIDGELVVSRIAESIPGGDMPTLYSIGR